MPVHLTISELAARSGAAASALRYYEDMSDVEIAALLGCSEATVRSHCSRALATLRTSNRLTEASNDHR